jgi:hypothetical protein
MTEAWARMSWVSAMWGQGKKHRSRSRRFVAARRNHRCDYPRRLGPPSRSSRLRSVKEEAFDGELEPGRAVPRLGAYPEVPELNGRSFMVGLQADMAAGKARGMRERRYRLSIEIDRQDGTSRGDLKVIPFANWA